MILYKDGKESPSLHPVDAAGWKLLGWTENPEPEPPPKKAVIVPDAGPPPSSVDGTTLKGSVPDAGPPPSSVDGTTLKGSVPKAK